MKNFIFTLFILLAFISNISGQVKSDYALGFEIGFKEGYCYNRTTYNCLAPMTPLAPMPRINESKDNYTEGYNRGFQFGLDLKRSKIAMDNSDNNLNNIPKFNNYVSQNPVEAMRVVGIYKQQKYDKRKQWIQERIYQLSDLIINLFNEQNLPGFAIEQTRNIYVVKRNNIINSISGFDYADDNQFRNVVNAFNSFENYLYSSYNSCIENEIIEKN